MYRVVRRAAEVTRVEYISARGAHLAQRMRWGIRVEV